MCFYASNSLELTTISNVWIKYSLPKIISEKDRSTIILLIDWLIEPSLIFVKEKCQQFISSSSNSLLLSFYKLYESMLQETLVLIEQNEKRDEQVYGAVVKKNKEQITEMIVAYFFVAIIWSIGAGLKEVSREQFSAFFNKLIRMGFEEHPK